MKIVFVLAALFLCLVAPPKIVYAAAWLQEKGNLQYISTFSYYESDQFFDDDGDVQASSDFQKLENTRYLEYGVEENLTLGATLRLTYQQVDDLAVYDRFLTGDATLRDFSHASTAIELFYRQALYEKDNIVVSFQPLVKLPEIFTMNGEQYHVDKHSYALEMRGLFGYGYQHDEKPTPLDKRHLPTPLAKQWHFASGEIAYRKHGNATPAVQDELRMDSTFGLRLHDDWLMLLQNFTTVTVDGRDDIGDGLNSKLQVSAIHRYKDGRGLQLSFYEDILGRNSGKGQGFIIGVWSGF